MCLKVFGWPTPLPPTPLLVNDCRKTFKTLDKWKTLKNKLENVWTSGNIWKSLVLLPFQHVLICSHVSYGFSKFAICSKVLGRRPHSPTLLPAVGRSGVGHPNPSKTLGNWITHQKKQKQMFGDIGNIGKPVSFHCLQCFPIFQNVFQVVFNFTMCLKVLGRPTQCLCAQVRKQAPAVIHKEGSGGGERRWPAQILQNIKNAETP